MVMLHLFSATEIGAVFKKTSASDFFLTQYATMNTLSKRGSTFLDISEQDE